MTPPDVCRVRVHQAKSVVRRVPELLYAAELGASRGDFAHERCRPTGRDEPVARGVAGVVRQAGGLEVTTDPVRAAVVRVVQRRLREPRISGDRGRADRGTQLVRQEKHVRGGRIRGRRELPHGERKADREAENRAEQREAPGTREIPPHLN